MNVTLKDLPADLHSRLKTMAEGNGRSLNRQIIRLLDIATSPKRTDDTDLLHRIQVNRQKSVGSIDQKFLREAIEKGHS